MLFYLFIHVLLLFCSLTEKKHSEYILFYSTTTPPELTRPDQTRSDLTQPADFRFEMKFYDTPYNMLQIYDIVCSVLL